MGARRLTKAVERALAQLGRPIFNWALELADSVDKVDAISEVGATYQPYKDYDKRLKEVELKLELLHAKGYQKSINEATLAAALDLYKASENPTANRDFQAEIDDARLAAALGLYQPQAQRPDPWPVGSVFVSTVNADPKDSLGYGTWEAFGESMELVTIDATTSEITVVGTIYLFKRTA